MNSEQTALDEAIDRVSDFITQRTDMVGYGPIIYSVHSNKLKQPANLTVRDLIALIQAAKEAQHLRAENERLRKPLDCQGVTDGKGKIG